MATLTLETAAHRLVSFLQETFDSFINPVVDFFFLGLLVVEEEGGGRRRLETTTTSSGGISSYINIGSGAFENHKLVDSSEDFDFTLGGYLCILLITFFIIICFLACYAHSQRTAPLFLSPRLHHVPHLVPPRPPVFPLSSWLLVCLQISDDELLSRVGLDAVVFLRFHRLVLRILLCIGVYSFLVLLPCNYYGGENQKVKDYIIFTDFTRLSMANVAAGPRLWLHVLGMVLLSLLVTRALLSEYSFYNAARHRHLLSRSPHLRSVLVEGVPEHLRAQHSLDNYFRRLYEPTAVRDVTLCQNLLHLEALVADREDVLADIERQLLNVARAHQKAEREEQQQQQQQGGEEEDEDLFSNKRGEKKGKVGGAAAQAARAA